MAASCPSCRGAMTETVFRTHVETALDIDICWSCHLIWFDNMESVSMSAQSVIDLFQQINARQNAARRIVSLPGNCPVCASTLKQTFDLSKAGRFQYHRCSNGHGRLSTFVQFLREKQFIRTLSKVERQQLSATVKQVRCSSCGASIHIERDDVCSHCGAPVSVLDEQAVAKALAELGEKRSQPAQPAPDRLQQPYQPTPSSITADSIIVASPALVDLIVTGVAAILSATLD